MHASSFAAEPFVMEHAGTVPHVLKSDKHHIPVSLAQVAVLGAVPHKQAETSLATEALVSAQTARSLAKQRHPSTPLIVQDPVASALVLNRSRFSVSVKQPGG